MTIKLIKVNVFDRDLIVAVTVVSTMTGGLTNMTPIGSFMTGTVKASLFDKRLQWHNIAAIIILPVRPDLPTDASF